MREPPNHRIFAKIKTKCMRTTKRLNPKYTHTDYVAEWAMYEVSKSPLRVLSIDFCIRFLEVMPSDETAHQNGFHGDHVDYALWGRALHGWWIEDEKGGGEVWKWIRIWETMLREGKELQEYTLEHLDQWINTPPTF